MAGVIGPTEEDGVMALLCLVVLVIFGQEWGGGMEKGATRDISCLLCLVVESAEEGAESSPVRGDGLCHWPRTIVAVDCHALPSCALDA